MCVLGFTDTISEEISYKMINLKDEIHSRRLKILDRQEIRNIFELPDFTIEERSEYFSLTGQEEDFLDSLRSLTSKIYFILQTGYFKARHLFFNFEFSDVPEDVEYILQNHFPNREIDVGSLRTVAKNTRLNGRQALVGFYQYQWCDDVQRQMIEEKVRAFAKISSKPIYIFREIVSLLREKRIILPGYSSLQDIVGQALVYEQNRLSDLLANSLKLFDISILDALLEDTDSFYEITQLKREPEDFSLNEIKREIGRADKLREIYRFAQKTLPLLEISNQSIAYYASLVSFYSVYKLNRFDRWTARLYLLCFAHQRYRRVNDNLINTLIYRLRQYTDQAKANAKENLSSMQFETNQDMSKVGRVLKLYTDEQISSEIPFGEVRQTAFEILSRQAIDRVAEQIEGEPRFDETELRWSYLDSISHRVKLNLRPILQAVDFSALSTSDDLLEAVDFLRRAFHQEISFQQIPTNNFPSRFIPETHKHYLYAINVDNTKRKRIIPDRYEILARSALTRRLGIGRNALPRQYRISQFRG